MPFIDVPAHRLTVFYAINPIERITFPRLPACVDPAQQDSDVRCAPYDAAKPTLVFLHANCRSVAAFNSQLLDVRVRARFNVLSFARRYHGRTRYAGEPSEELILEDAAVESIAILDALCTCFRISVFSIFAEGIAGCHLGTLIAAERPKQVLSLILASPGHLSIPGTYVDDGLRTIFEGLCQNKDGRGDGTGTIPEKVLADNGEYCFGSIGVWADEKRKVHNEAFQRRYGTGHSSSDLRQLFLSEARRMPIPLEHREKVVCPVLILHGARDTLVSPLKAAEEWRSGFPNAKGGADVKSITDGPHLLSFIDPNIVNRIILAFTSQVLSVDCFAEHARRTSLVR